MAVASSEASSRAEIRATSSTAAAKAASFAREGFVKPLILRTYWSEAARISSSVAGGAKLNNVLMFLHMRSNPAPRELSFSPV